MARRTSQQPGAKVASPARVAPGPAGSFLLGNLLTMNRQSPLRFYRDCWQSYGDVVRVQAGPLVQHLLAHPDHIRHVLMDNRTNYHKGTAYRKLKLSLGEGLLTSEGDLWRRQRRLMQPPFAPRSLAPYVTAMTESTEQMLKIWRSYAIDGEALDINDEMMRLAMSIIGRTMFSIDVGDDAAAAGRAFTFVLEYIGSRTVSMLDVPLFVPTPANRQFKAALHTLETFIDGIIGERRANPDQHDDLLAHLLRARDETTGEGMSDKQIRDEVLTIFFAGHETTAQALTWAWYLLALNPRIDDRLYAEVAETLPNRPLTIDDVPRLPYTRMVVDETLRLYPPVWSFARDAIDDDVIGGYHIPAGSMVLMSQYITHRHPSFWSNPEEFDPERFAPGRSEGRPQFAYFPFGGGPRTCIGNHFALLESQIVVASIARRYRLELAPGQRVETNAGATLRPKGGLYMIPHPRL
jgi:cytochrome P450